MFTKKIYNLQKAIDTIFTSEKYRRNFNTTGIQGTTINILGALMVFTDFNPLKSFKQQITKFNKEYFNLISGFVMDESIISDLHSFYYFCDNNYEFDIHEKQNYKYITDYTSVKALADYLLKFAKNYSQQSEENKDYLQKLAYFIAITYISNHEKDALSIFFSEFFEDEESFYDYVSHQIIDYIDKEIKIISGVENYSSNSLKHILAELDDSYWNNLMNDKEVKESNGASHKYDIITAIIEEYKIQDLAFLIVNHYKPALKNADYWMMEIVREVLFNIIKNRFVY